MGQLCNGNEFESGGLSGAKVFDWPLMQPAQPADQIASCMLFNGTPLLAGGHLGQAAYAAALDQPDAGRLCAGFENGFTSFESASLTATKQLLLKSDLGRRLGDDETL